MQLLRSVPENRKFRDLERVEEPERYWFSARDIDCERRTGALALLVEDAHFPETRFIPGQIVDGLYFTVIAKELRDRRRVGVCFVHGMDMT